MRRSLRKKTKLHQRGGIAYLLFKSYIRFFHDRIYYRHVYHIYTENIPEAGIPLMIVSNHQNCINDPIGILLSLNDRKPYFISRADVFDYHPLFSKFLRAVGLLPSFRIAFEGVEAVTKNKDIFLWSEKELLNGGTLVMFPEAGHQDKRWLGDFTFGYTRMAFEAAEMGNFEKEIFVLPACNHYSDYFKLREQILVKYGTPVSLKPFYELYQTKPRTAQRQLNALVRKQIESLMLDIRDLKNYEAIDFIRNTYGQKFALQHQYDAKKLPDRLLSDRLLVDRLTQIKEDSQTAKLDNIYADAVALKKYINELKINDTLFDRCPSWLAISGSILLLIISLPLGIFALWPNVLNLIAPHILISRMTDRMFWGTFVLTISVLITIPLLYTLTFVLTWIFTNVWWALIYLVMLPFIGLFAWYYWRFFKQTMQALRFRINIKTKKLNDLIATRKRMVNGLDELLSANNHIQKGTKF